MVDAAKWICHPLDSDETRLVPVFRRRFTVGNELKSATLRLTAHGVYETEINGKRVTENKFTPGLTSYYYRIQVQEYDVTGLLHEGENQWHTTVGDGWWRWNNNFGYRLAVWGVLELCYIDGGMETVGTDESFAVGTGLIVKSDLQKGETYDASIMAGNWMPAALETEHTDAVLIPNQGVPVREKEQFTGKLFRDSAGNLVADFGQNIAGYVRMVLHDTKPGQVVHLKHGEALDLEGKFSTANCDGGMTEFQEITYICKGAQREEYTPHFAYSGFRYALIEGVEDGEFTAIAVYSDMPQTGDFHCSNPLINKLLENARWSQKGNFLDVPVDCPTRERNAWTGDAQIYVKTAAYFMDVEQFFTKWLADQRLEQYASGKVGITFPSTSSVHNPEELKRVQAKRPDMALAGPEGNGNIGEDSVGWGDSAVWLPYQLYLMYGDKQILADHYDTAKRWLEFSLSCMKEKNPLYAQREWYQNGDGDFIYDTHSQCDIIRLSKMQTQSSHGLTSACIFRFLRREPCRQQQIVHPQLYLKNFISNRREQPAWAAKRNSSTIPVFRSTKSSTSPGASCLTSSPTTKAKKVSGSFGSGWLSVKRIRRKERKGKSKQVTAQGAASLAAPFLMQQALHSRI